MGCLRPFELNGEYDGKKKVDALAVSVGKAIAARRQDAGLTQEQVAEQLKIGNEAVSRMERGLVMPTVARLLELADLFNCDASSYWWSPATARPSRHSTWRRCWPAWTVRIGRWCWRWWNN
jgi:DNA-binding XRE family transcriptional regulator